MRRVQDDKDLPVICYTLGKAVDISISILMDLKKNDPPLKCEREKRHIMLNGVTQQGNV